MCVDPLRQGGETVRYCIRKCKVQPFHTCSLLCFQVFRPATEKKSCQTCLTTEDSNTLTLISLPRGVSSELINIISIILEVIILVSIILEVTIILGLGYFLISYKIGHYTIKPYNY